MPAITTKGNVAQAAAADERAEVLQGLQVPEGPDQGLCNNQSTSAADAALAK